MTSIPELVAQVKAIGAVQQAVELQGEAIERLESRIAELTREVAALKAASGRRK
jgi:uncharacterized small protein (DUF1192 family)